MRIFLGVLLVRRMVLRKRGFQLKVRLKNTKIVRELENLTTVGFIAGEPTNGTFISPPEDNVQTN
ncbi:MAG: hypothetical protein KTR30_24675 [Saprospiraceae bacterium]|nr:hypothetical protein [Saprospiraceae bacterium]